MDSRDNFHKSNDRDLYDFVKILTEGSWTLGILQVISTRNAEHFSSHNPSCPLSQNWYRSVLRNISKIRLYLCYYYALSSFQICNKWLCSLNLQIIVDQIYNQISGSRNWRGWGGGGWGQDIKSISPNLVFILSCFHWISRDMAPCHSLDPFMNQINNRYDAITLLPR